ncbi:MAG TPA: mycothiol synthase [Nocardioidaceae bacterium]|nr:mycothiol synthase [Nocardioidaceae bacterium]
MPEPDHDVRLQASGRLDGAEVSAVRRIVEAATELDGVRPLSEHVMLHLRYGGDEPGRNVLLWEDDELAAYAHLDVTDTVEGPSAELVVAPAHRGRGLGRRLVETLIEASPDGRLRLWAHGETSAAVELALGMGFVQMRTLWQMRRSLYAALPPVEAPYGVVVRTFRPGEDDEAWAALNARAFATHPEQGTWTLEDLHRRMGEPWFDPAGFFVAERSGPDGPRMVGFHWTKVHGSEPAGDGHGHEPIGEVYVVGVDPSEQGSGLGRVLTVVGLRHLRSLDLAEAMLYVDADNTAAIRLYTGLGFTHWDTDRMFRRPLAH